MTEPAAEPNSDLQPGALLNVAEVCAWFKVTKDWVYDEVEAGRLPYVRLGRRHLRFRRSDLDQYLAANVQRRAVRPTSAGQNPPGGLEPLH